MTKVDVIICEGYGDTTELARFENITLDIDNPPQFIQKNGSLYEYEHIDDVENEVYYSTIEQSEFLNLDQGESERSV